MAVLGRNTRWLIEKLGIVKKEVRNHQEASEKFVLMAILGRKTRWLVEKLGIVKKLARRGCFAVYVGEERERRVIPVKYLSSVILQALFNQCRDQSDERTGLYLCCSPEFLSWVLELAKTELEEIDPNLATMRDGIIHADTRSMQTFGNYIVMV